MATQVDAEQLVESARTAVKRRRYGDAYRALHRARGQRPLEPDDQAMLAEAAWWLGQVSECLAICESLHRHYLDHGEVDRAALQALDLGGMWVMRGEFSIASGWFSRGRRLLEGQPRGRGHALLAYADACQALEEERLDEAVAAAEEMQEISTGVDDETFLALGLLVKGLVDIRRGRLREGFAVLDEAMLPVLADRVSRDFAGNIYCTIMSVCYDLMDLARAREWTRATERWIQGFSDAVMFLGVCRAHRMQLHAIEGAWAEVEKEAAQVERDLADMNLGAVAETAYQLGETFRIRGLHDRAAQSYRLAAARGRDPEPGAALLQLATGDADGACAAVTAAVATAGRGPFTCARLLRAQVEIAIASGQLGTAASAARRLEAIRDGFGTPGFMAWADEARGAVLLAEGHAAEAVPLLSAATGRLSQMDAPYDAARAAVLLSEALAATGDAEAAQVHQRAALDAFARLGVPSPFAPRTIQRPPGGLTSREAEVLSGVARGASNREVAAALSISEATVRRHLANIYAKLGVGSRTAAAAWAHECGLLAPGPA